MAGANTLPMFHCLQPSTLRSYAQKSAAPPWLRSGEELPPANTAPILSTYRREHPPNLPQPAALHPPLTLSEIGRGRLGSARARDDWGRREKYGNAVLATTDGQRRAQCPTSSERAKPYALKTQNAALKAGEHCALRCPDVGVSTHSIFLPPAAVPRPSGAKAAVADFVPLP